MFRRLRVLFVIALLASCSLAQKQETFDVVSNTVRVGSVTYPVTKSVLSVAEDVGGEFYFFLDLMQDGVFVTPDGNWDNTNSNGFALEFQIYSATNTREGTFSKSTTKDELDSVYAATFSSGAPTPLINLPPDSGQVTISISGSTVTVKGSVVVSGGPVVYDFTGPFTESVLDGSSIAAQHGKLKLRN